MFETHVVRWDFRHPMQRVAHNIRVHSFFALDESCILATEAGIDNVLLDTHVAGYNTTISTSRLVLLPHSVTYLDTDAVL